VHQHAADRGWPAGRRRSGILPCLAAAWIVAGIAAGRLLVALLTFQDAPPADRSAPRDARAIGLAAAGSVAAFWGAAELTSHSFTSPVVLGPLLGGLALIIVLWVYQYRSRNPLMRLRIFATTIPVSGTVVAICAAAASTSAIGLTGTVLARHYPPLHVGLLYVPELGATVIAAIMFGVVFRSRYIHYFPRSSERSSSSPGFWFSAALSRPRKPSRCSGQG
jgi:hypothetical protein